MGKQIFSPLIDHTTLSVICRQLANPHKVAVIDYIRYSGMATASVIQRKLSFKQSTVSKYVHALTECGLLVREKIGYSIVYTINQKTWCKFNDYLSNLGK